MIRLAKALVLATSLLLPAYLVRFSVFGIPTTALEVLIVTTFVVTTATTWGRWKFPPRPFFIATGLFVLSALIATAIAPDKRLALGILKAWIAAPILFGWAVYQLVGVRGKGEGVSGLAEAILTTLIASGVLVALTAIYQRLTGDLTADGRALGIYGYFPGENASPNFAALYLAPVGAVSFALLTEQLKNLKTEKRRSALQSSVLSLSLFIIVYGLLLTDSRGGLIGLTAGVFVALLLYFREWIMSRGWAKTALVVALAAGLIAGWQIAKPNFALSPVEGGRITSSNNLRWEIWKTTIEMLQAPNSKFQIPNWVLGAGLGNYQNHFTEFTKDRPNFPEFIAPQALTPHNLFLSVWVNLGLLGLVGFLWLIGLTLKKGIENIKGIEGSQGIKLNRSILSIVLISSIISIFVHGLVDTPYFKNDLSVFFWILVVLIAATANHRNLSNSRE